MGRPRDLYGSKELRDIRFRDFVVDVIDRDKQFLEGIKGSVVEGERRDSFESSYLKEAYSVKQRAAYVRKVQAAEDYRLDSL